MKSVEQIKRGAMLYIASEIVPMMPVGKALLLEAVAPNVIEGNIRSYISKDWLANSGLVDGTNIDVDELYKQLKSTAANRWPVELFGIRFSEADLDKLYNFIREA